MVRLVVQTQYMEYYGDPILRDGRWKFKGGSEYIVAELTIEEACRGTAAVKAIVDQKSGQVEYKNPMSQEYITDWDLVFDGEMTPGEKHAAQLIRDFDADPEEVERLYHPKVLEVA